MKSMIIFAIMAFGLYANEFTLAVENYNKGEYEKAFDTFYILYLKSYGWILLLVIFGEI